MGQIVLHQVSKTYPGGVRGVDELNLEIGDGEFMVLVGPSGCGKSTALRSIAGLEEVTAGSISIGGRVVNGLPPKDRDIAMVFQNYALYPHMSVAQNLAFGLEQRRTPKPEVKQRVGQVARMLGLEELLGRKPAALSGGQRQRVAMGRAIVREPQAFLMDEPLSNLDAKLRVSMRASLAQLHARLGVTTVYVTHDQVEAMTLGQRVCVLHEGRLQQAGPPQELYRSPVNLFVAGFIGSPAMNFAAAELVRDDGLALVFAGYRLPVPAEAVAARPALGGWVGRSLILGVRPADFEDGALAEPGWPRLAARAEVTEDLGSEIHVIFTIDAPPLEHPELSQALPGGEADETALALDGGTPALDGGTPPLDGGALPLDGGAPALDGGKSRWTARVSARSQVRPGEPAELAVDPASLYFFDPDSGRAIGED